MGATNRNQWSAAEQETFDECLKKDSNPMSACAKASALLGRSLDACKARYYQKQRPTKLPDYSGWKTDFWSDREIDTLMSIVDTSRDLCSAFTKASAVLKRSWASCSSKYSHIINKPNKVIPELSKTKKPSTSAKVSSEVKLSSTIILKGTFTLSTIDGCLIIESK
jgi:hypothetical protein